MAPVKPPQKQQQAGPENNHRSRDANRRFAYLDVELCPGQVGHHKVGVRGRRSRIFFGPVKDPKRLSITACLDSPFAAPLSAD
jgi:hypothetical protein